MGTELWMWCPLRSMTIPLSAGENPHPRNCSRHFEDDHPAWHTVAAVVMLRDALRVCYLRNCWDNRIRAAYEQEEERGQKLYSS